MFIHIRMAMELGARNSAADQRMGKAKGQMVGYC